MLTWKRLGGAVGLAVVLAGTWSDIGVTEEAKRKLTYVDDVRAILREHCFACHNQNKARNDLAVDSYERTLKGGAGGPSVQPGDLQGSYLWRLTNHDEEPHMPLNQDKLADAKLAILKQWILDGALKDAGSASPAKAQPKVALTVVSGAARPEGPPPMPEGWRRRAIISTVRPGSVTAIACSPWAPLVAIAGQKQLAVWHTDSLVLLGVGAFPEGIPHVLKFSRSGSLLVAGGGHAAQQGRVVVYDVRTGERVFEVGDELDVVLGADISQDHNRIALGGPGKMVRVFATADGSQLYELRKHTDWICAVEFSPDGVLLATADRGGGLRVWESESGNEYLNLQGHTAAVTDVSWRADSNVLVSASEDGTVRVWEMENGRQLKSVSAHPAGVTSVSFAHDGRFVSGGRDKTVKAWDPSGNPVRTFGPMAELVTRVAFTHDGARVLAGDLTGEIRVWDAADGKQVATLSSSPPEMNVLIEQRQGAFASAQAAAEKAAAELALTEKALAQMKANASQAANQVSEIAALEKTQAEQAASAKKAAEVASGIKADLDALLKEKAASEKPQ